MASLLRIGKLDLLMAVLTPQSFEICGGVVRNEVLWDMSDRHVNDFANVRAIHQNFVPIFDPHF
jgi:hypothetical protein